ncbi:MAG: dCMP deaminase family protein [Clostridia bacterium]|nr:dCMP deaminase family protein [Clostridia bacterium]
MAKRQDYISWDEYFMGIAMLSAKRSKDPSTQVGACIVSDENKVVSIGYNGMPKGLKDDEACWEREGDFLNTKYAYVVHAELNAILNSRVSVQGCRIYVSLFPCNECAKAIVQSGIKEVLFLSNKYKNADSSIASASILQKAGVKLTQLNFENKEILLKLS